MPLSAEEAFAEAVESIRNLYHRYSVDDIATALFVSDLWLPNIASPVKHLLFATALCSMHPDEFAGTATIKQYAEFKRFLEELYSIAPDLAGLEDYVPEPDWGEVKFPLKKRTYRIFYGGDLSNVYDYLALYQILYEPFDRKLAELTTRSPMAELEQVLKLQDAIISGISSQPSRDDLEIAPGDTKIPSEGFWRDAIQVFQSCSLADNIGRELLAEFIKKPGDLPREQLTRDTFGGLAADSLSFTTMFVEYNGRHLLMLPRRWPGILYDVWGKLLRQHQSALEGDGMSPGREIGGQFCRFLRERFSEKEVLYYVSARAGARGVHEVVFQAAIWSKDKLVLWYVLPPTSEGQSIVNELAEIAPKLREAIRLLQVSPTQLILRGAGQGVEFQSDSPEKALVPVVFVVLPRPYTGPLFLELREELPARFALMDSVLAVLDELYEVEDLSDFIEYLDSLENTFGSPLVSLLDKFASFKDTDGVLISGASTPSMVVIDPHWGGAYRYESLAKFWALYPEKDFFGHPRSWKIQEWRPGRLALMARSHLGLVLCFKIRTLHCLVTSPFELMSSDQGRIASFLTECAEDNLYQYRNLIAGLRTIETSDKLVILLLAPWRIDAAFTATRALRVRIVYNEETVTESFQKVSDRSMEAALLLEIVRQIDSLDPDPKLAAVADTIENSKAGQPGFKLLTEKKPASFPEFARTCLPSPRDFKLAKKRIAELAKLMGVTEGHYDLEAAKDKLNELRKAMVAEINEFVGGFEFTGSIPKLVGWADALENERERDRITIERSVEHHVEYSRDEDYSENEEKFIRMHRNYRYLIEKFVQLQPDGKAPISEEQARSLLALIDWFFVIIDTSDVIHYDIAAVGINVDRDLKIEIQLGEDIEGRQSQLAQEDARVRLGLAGNPKDGPGHPLSVQERTTALDEAFRKDFGFGFSSLIGVSIVLTHWPESGGGALEAPTYSATRDEIVDVAGRALETLSHGEVDSILDFLTLKSEQILRVLRDDRACDDLPVWEHKKRPMRYTLRPLIRVGAKYLWGPYATRRAGLIWAESPSLGTLPADIGGANINCLLQEWKRLLDNELATQAAEIVRRFTTHVLSNAKLHRLDRVGGHPEDLGDYDVLAYYPEAHAILSVECKNILPAFCLKDARTMRETIFGVPGKDEGHFGQVDKRTKYLREHWAQIAKILNWPLSSADSPKVFSLYVTPTTYWWTRFPPREVDTTFVRMEMLSAFIEGLLAQ